MAVRRVMVVKSGGEAAMEEWRACFAGCAPGLELRWWDWSPERVKSAALVLNGGTLDELRALAPA